MTDGQAALLQQVATDVAVLKGAILGNGTKGLADRVNEVEAWKGTHPRDCPMPKHIEDTEDTPKQGRTNAWIVAGVVIAAITGGAGLIIGVVK